MIPCVLLVILGFTLLIKGADLLVDGASNLAKKFYIPEIIIGLTILSIGTSLPELIVSITSAINGYSDLAVGNIVGSNIANLLLVLGLSAMIKSVSFNKETKLIDIPICLGVSIIFLILANLGQNITRMDAIILVLLFIVFIIYTIVMTFRNKEIRKENKGKDDGTNESTIKNIIYIILGIAILKIGGDLTVDNAISIANFFNLSEKIIAVTILAAGTSLPELVTSVSAAIKGKSDIAIGNILGSCVFNMLLIIGVSALIKPIKYNMSYNIDMIFLLLGTLVLVLFPIIPPKNKMSRGNGSVYFSLYIIYLLTLFIK